jgi:hypothetical protein
MSSASTETTTRRTWRTHPLFSALRERRSRRFAFGGRLEGGPLDYASEHEPVPLTEEERAILAFAATGITGWALNDLGLGPGQGGTMMGGLTGRTVASLDALQAVSLIVTDDEGTWLVRRAADLPPDEVRELIDLAAREEHVEIFRRQAVKLSDERIRPPLEPPSNIPLNRWALHRPGTTYFLPVGDMTLPYINVGLELLNEENALFPVDERARFAPAGIGRFGKRKGGHLDDSGARHGPIRELEIDLAEMVSIEIGMVLQNLGLACDALGLGGYPNYAGIEAEWFERLGFRMAELPISRYLGADPIVRSVLRVRRLDTAFRFPIGLEMADGQVLLRSYRPPYFGSMREAVEAVVERKLGPGGIYRETATTNSGWRDPANISTGVPAISKDAIEATTAFCEYVFDRYGRFPALVPAFRTNIGFQASHLDVGFYDRHYRSESLSDRHRHHFESELHAAQP